MARTRAVDNRFDLRGGVNTQMSQDTLDSSEVRRALNARQYTLGTYEKRAGTQRLHTAAIGAGADVTGVFAWRPALTRQLVAVAGGNFYHKTLAAADFTQVAATLSLTERARFATYRDATLGLFIATGKLSRWDGVATFTEAVGGAPDAVDVCIYKGRGFAIEADSKTLFISEIRDLATWALEQDVETYDMEPLVALAKAGSSLLLAKENSIARFTGISQDEIRIDLESEGVAANVGCIARHTFIELDGEVFTLSDKGPYLVTEAGVEPVHMKVSREFDFANKEFWQDAVATYHHGRREIQLTIPAGGESANETTWVLNLTTRAWDGPFVYPFGVSSSARLEREDGSESVVIGGYDGFVRDGDVLDIDHDDDVLRDGSGGAAIEYALQYPDLLGGAPGLLKSLTRKHFIRADLGLAGVLVYEWESDMGSGSVQVVSKGDGVRAYPVKFRNAKGSYIRRTLRESTGSKCLVAGIQGTFSYGRALRE